MVSEWFRRVWYLLNRSRFERSLRKEMEEHREMMGEPIRFGNALRLREESSDVWGWNRLDGLYRDFAIRFDFTGGELGLLPLPPLPGAGEGRPDPYTYDRKTDDIPPGFYPARVFGKDFIVPVILNDRLPSYFLIDSGASTTMMAKRLAERLGPLRTSNMQVFGLSGQVKNVWEAVPVTMNVLGLAQRHERMLVVDLDGYAGGRAGFNGLLGYTFLQHSILTFDDRNGLVRLELGQVTRTPSRRR